MLAGAAVAIRFMDSIGQTSMVMVGQRPALHLWVDGFPAVPARSSIRRVVSGAVWAQKIRFGPVAVLTAVHKLPVGQWQLSAYVKYLTYFHLHSLKL